MKRAVVAVLCSVALSGCGTLNDDFIVNAAMVDSNDDPSVINGSKPPQPINLDTYCFPGTTDCISNKETAYQKAVNNYGDRKRLIYILLKQSERVCQVHKGAIMANAAALNFSSGFLSATLSTLSAAFSPPTTKTALSAGAAVIDAGRTGMQAEVYQNLISSAVIKEIDRLRKENRVLMENKRIKKGEDYTIEEALDDITQFHNLCSFYVGVSSLTESRERKALTKTEIQAEIDLLVAENVEIQKSMIAAGSGDQRSALENQLLNNNLRIETLRGQRTRAPGPVPVLEKAEQVLGDKNSGSEIKVSVLIDKTTGYPGTDPNGKVTKDSVAKFFSCNGRSAAEAEKLGQNIDGKTLEEFQAALEKMILDSEKRTQMLETAKKCL